MIYDIRSIGEWRDAVGRVGLRARARAKNRKPLLRETAIGATWEVRCGPGNRFRLFYEIHRDRRLVVVLAIARKVGNRLFVGREKFEP